MNTLPLVLVSVLLYVVGAIASLLLASHERLAIRCAGLAGAAGAVCGLAAAIPALISGQTFDMAIGGDQGAQVDEYRDRAEIDAADGKALRQMIGEVVAPMYYERPAEFAAIARSSIALNGSFFNTHRMAIEYMARAYSGTVRAIG